MRVHDTEERVAEPLHPLGQGDAINTTPHRHGQLLVDVQLQLYHGIRETFKRNFSCIKLCSTHAQTRQLFVGW